MKKLHTYLEGLLDTDIGDLSDVEEIAVQEKILGCLKALGLDKVSSIKDREIKVNKMFMLQDYSTKAQLKILNEFFNLISGHTFKSQGISFDLAHKDQPVMHIENINFECDSMVIWYPHLNKPLCNFHFNNCNFKTDFASILFSKGIAFKNTTIYYKSEVHIELADDELYRKIKQKQRTALKNIGLDLVGSGTVLVKNTNTKSEITF